MVACAFCDRYNTVSPDSEEFCAYVAPAVLQVSLLGGKIYDTATLEIIFMETLQ